MTNPFRTFAPSTLCLGLLLLTPACRAIESAAPMQFSGAPPIEWSKRMADSETACKGDKLAWKEGGSAKWDYTAGLFTLSLLKFNEQVPSPAYVAFVTNAIGSFVSDDGKSTATSQRNSNSTRSIPARPCSRSGRSPTKNATKSAPRCCASS